MSLTSLLVQREVATIRDVEEAISHQVVYGGDLVTNLLESAKVDEEKLVEALSESTGLRAAGAGPLGPTAEQARSMVSREVATAHDLVPLALSDDGEQLIVAVSEPLTPADDEKLMFALGIPVVQRVAPLVRIREALARDYQVPLDRRFDRLLRRLRGEAVESLAPPPVKPKPAAPAVEVKKGPLVPRTTINQFPAPQGVAGSGAVARRTTPSSTPTKTFAREGATGPRPPRRRRGPITFEKAKRELEGLEERDALLDLFFDFSRQYFDYAALFLVHGDLAEGRDAFGSGAPREKVAAVGVPLDMPSLLSVARERAVPVVDVPQSEGIDAIFVSDIGRPIKDEVIVVPLVVRRRAVALLYGDCNDTGAQVENPSDVTTFALLIGQAFERVIVKKKKVGSDRQMPRVVQVSARDVTSEDRTHRALALSRALQEATPASHSVRPSVRPSAPPLTGRPMSAPPPPMPPISAAPPSPLSEPTSPVAASVPPPADLGAADEIAPPPANVLLVRRPSGPPIPREDPVDPTSRPPDRVFPEPSRASQAPRAPARPSTPPASPPPPAAIESDIAAPSDTDETPLLPLAELAGEPFAPAPVSPAAFEPNEVPTDPESETISDPAPAPPPQPHDFDEDEDPDGVARGSPRSEPPSRIESQELSPNEARRVLGEIEEEIDDDMIEEEAPISLIPASQTVVVAPHRPPTSRTDTENLPTIMVDVSAELEILVREILAGKNEERAEQELLRQGAQAMPAILASFPGPTRNEPSGSEEFFPPFSTCGPVLRLVASQRRVALPYVLPLVADEREERRFWATFALTELAYPEALPAILPRLFDESVRIRKAARLAVAAASRVFGEQVARELGRYARDQQNDRRRRIEVLRLLEEVREPLAVPTFIALLDDPDQEIEAIALHALEVLARQELGGDPKKWKSWWNANSSRHRVEWLIDALMHDSLPIRKAASDELKAITKEYFGYYPDEAKRDREKAQARYRQWWQAEGRMKFAVS